MDVDSLIRLIGALGGIGAVAAAILGVLRYISRAGKRTRTAAAIEAEASAARTHAESVYTQTKSLSELRTALGVDKLEAELAEVRTQLVNEQARTVRILLYAQHVRTLLMEMTGHDPGPVPD